MDKLIERIRVTYPGLVFTAAKQFYWSPASGEIFYKANARGKKADWSLLHETGHALLGHQNFAADLDLLQLEVSAWQMAEQLAGELGLKIDEDHIQDCLDTYRDWLYKR